MTGHVPLPTSWGAAAFSAGSVSGGNPGRSEALGAPGEGEARLGERAGLLVREEERHGATGVEAAGVLREPRVQEVGYGALAN